MAVTSPFTEWKAYRERTEERSLGEALSAGPRGRGAAVGGVSDLRSLAGQYCRGCV